MPHKFTKTVEPPQRKIIVEWKHWKEVYFKNEKRKKKYIIMK